MITAQPSQINTSICLHDSSPEAVWPNIMGKVTAKFFLTSNIATGRHHNKTWEARPTPWHTLASYVRIKSWNRDMTFNAWNCQMFGQFYAVTTPGSQDDCQHPLSTLSHAEQRLEKTGVQMEGKHLSDASSTTFWTVKLRYLGHTQLCRSGVGIIYGQVPQKRPQKTHATVALSPPNAYQNLQAASATHQTQRDLQQDLVWPIIRCNVIFWLPIILQDGRWQIAENQDQFQWNHAKPTISTSDVIGLKPSRATLQTAEWLWRPMPDTSDQQHQSSSNKVLESCQRRKGPPQVETTSNKSES